MEVRATAKIKIIATPEIVRTMRVYHKALQFCVNQAWKHKISNKFKLQTIVYKNIRKKGLQAQLAITCIRQACATVKKAKTKPKINRVSIRYNFPRSASMKNNVLSLATVKGRVKIPFTIPDCYKKYFNWKINESLLRIDRKGRCFFLFCFSKDVKTKSSDFQNRVLGVDVGINYVAVTSNRQFFNARQIKLKKIKFKKIRSKLQAKGTRSSQKLLKKISGREKRFMAYWNHIISKEIVNNCEAGTIVLENLKGIRKQRRGKLMNYWISNWSFYQLQSFIKYKAMQKGIRVIKVSPYMTSQTCSKCGKVGARSKGFFNCLHCGYSLNADLNASFNLAKRHSKSDGVSGIITSPNIQGNEHKGTSCAVACELMDKSPAL